ncbi:MAG: glycosyltransferase family 87 protein [Acidimicrobiia bacterium]
MFLLQLTLVDGHIGKNWARQSTIVRFSVLAISVAAIWFGLLGEALVNTTIFDQVRGGTADWLVTVEAATGSDSYAPVSDLARDHLGWLDVGPNSAHPRPPSAVLLLIPLALIPSRLIIIALMTLSAGALVVWVQSSIRWMRAGVGYEWLAIPFAVTAPLLQGVVWGTHMPLVAAAIGASMLASGHKRGAWRGFFVGIASGLKVFPFGAALAYKERRWVTVMTAVATVLGLSLVGLLLPGLSFESSLAALFDAADTYGNSIINMSVSYHIGGGLPVALLIAVLGLVLIFFTSNRTDPWVAVPTTLIITVLVSPLAWPEYLVLTFPGLLVLALSGKRALLSAFLIWLVMVWSTDGTTLMLAAMAIALALALPEVRVWTEKNRTEELISSGP